MGPLGRAPECGPDLGRKAHLSATVGTWVALEARGGWDPLRLAEGQLRTVGHAT